MKGVDTNGLTALVGAVFGGLVLLIPVVVNMIIALRTRGDVTTIQHSVDTMKSTADASSKSTDEQLGVIHQLTNSNLSEALKRIAKLEGMLVKMSGEHKIGIAPRDVEEMTTPLEVTGQILEPPAPVPPGPKAEESEPARQVPTLAETIAARQAREERGGV